MANKKLTDLTPATFIGSGDLFYMVQSGADWSANYGLLVLSGGFTVLNASGNQSLASSGQLVWVSSGGAQALTDVGLMRAASGMIVPTNSVTGPGFILESYVSGIQVDGSGTTQGSTQLTAEMNVVTINQRASGGGAGAILPVPLAPGVNVAVVNNNTSGTPITVYPNSGAIIGAGGSGQGYTVPYQTTAFFRGAPGLWFADPIGMTLIDYQVYTTPGSFTWTKPTPAGTAYLIDLTGPGGGGGGGAGAGSGVIKQGGSAGGGGARQRIWLTDQDLGATEPVQVGSGGAGGAGGTSGVSGAPGITGGVTFFGSRSGGFNSGKVFAYGGGAGFGGLSGTVLAGGGGGGAFGPGSAGSTANGLGGLPTSGLFAGISTGGASCGVNGVGLWAEFGGAAGGGANTGGAIGLAGGVSAWGGAGGGGGGGVSAGNVPQSGGGGGGNDLSLGTSGGGGAGGGFAGNGASGGLGDFIRGGQGGGGGGGASGTTGGKGGGGGFPGGGGGGGGGGTTTGGNGGPGANGRAVVATFR